VQGVGEHEGARDEGHAEHDGQGGQGQAKLVREQPLRTTFHMSAAQLLHPLENGVGRGREELVDDVPSARNTTRSA
jgi:hypothetical protein